MNAPDTDPTPPTPAVSDTAERPVRPALLRGWRRRCPRCGASTLMSGYLRVRDHCPSCGQAFHHHRADDGPAYITILLVGHIMAPFMHVYFTQVRPEPLVMATVLSVGCVALSLFLLPRVKGALVGIQWSRRMHGFGDETG